MIKEFDISQAKDKTLAFISSYDEICGNATYTKQLMEQVRPYFKKVDIIKLDQFLIHSAKLCGMVEKDVLAKINNYDYLNIQWEPGLFASRQKNACRFFIKIIDQFQGKAISITSHSLNFDPEFLRQKNVLKYKILKALFPKSLKRQAISNYFYQNLVIKYINSLCGKKSVSLIVHQENLKKILSYYTKIPVYDHPIVSPTSDDIAKYNNPNVRGDIIKKYNLDKDKIYCAVFGFYGPYKGIDLAIKALKYLPENYHLIIGSNVHPTSNFAQRNINVKSIVSKDGQENIVIDVQQNKYLQYIINLITDKEEKNKKDNNNEIKKTKIIDRIHYINHIFIEDDFKQLIAGVDIAILPYYEVGQGGSGPTSYATFLTHSGKIILSRTGCFEQYSQTYFPECFTFFDQGNEIELAKKMLTVQSKRDNLLKETANFNSHTNAMTYVKSLIF